MISLSLSLSVVTVGLLQPNVTVRENETFFVCTELTSGALERDIFVGLLVSNNSGAMRELIHQKPLTMHASVSE